MRQVNPSHGPILLCDGYKMYRGALMVMPDDEGGEPYIDRGVCLYRPDTDCWYVQGTGFATGYPASDCKVCACQDCKHFREDPMGHVMDCHNPDGELCGTYPQAGYSCEAWEAN